MFPPSSDDQQAPSLHDLLEQCAINLTEKAAQGNLNRAYEREAEIEQILTALASPLKGRIVITGGARVGKTAIIHEVAARLQSGNCPDSLLASEVWSLSARSILRAFGVQGWQEKLGRLMELWVERPDIILYVDALPSIHMAGATAEDPFDMAQFLLGQLQSSNNRLLTEGRTEPVRLFLDAYSEYKHIMLEVKVSEPPLDIITKIVQQASQELSTNQKTTITEEAQEAAIDVTRRFALQEQLPGKALDLIGECMALQSEQQEQSASITKNEVIDRFGEQTGLPRILLSDDEPYDEQAVYRRFSNQVLGQEQAVDAIVHSLSLLRTRLNNPNRPMGVFLFMGPTGVGKTELARALAQFLFGDDELIVRFNMADYSSEWHVQNLFGNPHGFDPESRRGVFTSRLQDHSFAVILLDEFEKAHPEVYQRFLQLFDEGILINTISEALNLRNSIVILTSNFGARMLSAEKLGFGPSVTPEEQERQIQEELVRFFTPELINRLDSVCFFKPLTKSVLREIAYRRVQEILQREGIIRRRIDVEVDKDVIEWVVENGYSERYGARYLSRQIEKTITYPLAQQLIRNNPPEKSSLRLFVHNDRIASALVLPPTSHEEEVLPAATTMPSLTLDHLHSELATLTDRVVALEATTNMADIRANRSTLLQELSTPSAWDDPQKLQTKLTQIDQANKVSDQIDGLRRNLDELTELLEPLEENDPDLLSEAIVRYRYLIHEVPRAELSLLFTHPWDECSAYLHLEAVGRRTVAAEWLSEVGQMYLNWAERRKLRTTLLSESLSQKGQTRALWMKIEGYGAYGLLRGEFGLHQLIQAHQKSGKRQIVKTTLSVWPSLPQPDLAEEESLPISISTQPIKSKGNFIKSLETQVDAQFKAETLPALRFTGDLPTETLIQEAITLLHTQAATEINSAISKQTIRTYSRYRQPHVHDWRTGLKITQVDEVLKGEIDSFLETYLEHIRTPDEQNEKS